MRITTRVRRRITRLKNRRIRERELPPIVVSSAPYRYDACLRLFGLGDNQREIEAITGLSATRAHREGDPFGLRGRVRKEDLWLYASPLDGRVNHDEHIKWLWTQIKPHREHFRKLVKQAASADICLGCLSEHPYPLLSISPESLDIVRELELGITFNFTVL